MKWSRWLTWLGIAVAVVGIVIAIWLEVSVDKLGLSGNGFITEARLDDAALGIGMIGSGALLAVAAQIMGMMQASRTPRVASDPVVAELSEP